MDIDSKLDSVDVKSGDEGSSSMQVDSKVYYISYKIPVYFKTVIQTESSYICKNIVVIFLFGNGVAEPGYCYPIPRLFTACIC